MGFEGSRDGAGGGDWRPATESLAFAETPDNSAAYRVSRYHILSPGIMTVELINQMHSKAFAFFNQEQAVQYSS